MAVQGISTLADLNIPGIRQAYRQQAERNFLEDFQLDLQKDMMGRGSKLFYKDDKLSFTPGAGPITKEGLWNRYIQKASEKNMRPDLNYYTQYIEPMLQGQNIQSIPDQLQSVKALGATDKDIRDFAKNNPAFSSYLTSYAMQDPLNATTIAPYITEQKGILDWLSKPGSALQAGAGIAGTAGALTALNPMLKNIPAVRTAIPFLAPMVASPLAKALGATDTEADVAQGIASGGAGAYMASQAKKGYNKLTLAAQASEGTLNQLRARAKKLGIEKTSKMTKSVIQKEIADKVIEQGTKKTSSQLGKTALKKVGTKALGRLGASALGGPVGWAVGAGLTAWDLYQLMNALYSE